MQNKRKAAQQRLAAALARTAPIRASSLARDLNISVPTLHRLLHECSEPVLTVGRARRTRYALRKALRGDLTPVPIHAIDELGHPHFVTDLSLIQPQGCWADLSSTGWPLNEDSRDGWWAGLPYPLYDMRPQGYLGRQLAHRVQDTLAVSPNMATWTDDDILWVLSQMGTDMPGNLIVGEISFRRWQGMQLNPLPIIAASEIAPLYAQAAEQAVALGLAGSSAAGEFPKFTALREAPGALTPHVIVKFSGANPDSGTPPVSRTNSEFSPTVRRWADLLIAEHLALEAVRGLPGVEAAPSCIRQFGGRTFLEVERFDRHGAFGRSPVITFETANAELLGKTPCAWGPLADAFCDARLLSAEQASAVHCITWFGSLIANNDMHLGNLSFRPSEGTLHLCPVYDMLPMAYAPLPGGELPSPTFAPLKPLSREQASWRQACSAAMCFWENVANDGRVSRSFQVIAEKNAAALAGSGLSR